MAPPSPRALRLRHATASTLLFATLFVAPRAEAGATEVASFPLDDAFYNVGSIYGFYPHAPTLATRRDGARLYVPLGYDAGDLAVFDVSDALQPSLVRAPGIPARSLAASGALVYAVDGLTLRIADLSDPAAPVLLREIPLNGGLGAPALSVRLHRAGGRRYALITGGGPFLGDAPALRAVDVTDPANAALVGPGSEEVGGADLAIAGSLACVASYEAGLRCFDVGDPAHPVLRGETGTLGVATAVGLRDGIAYVLNAGLTNAPLRASLVTVDVRDPSRPTIVGVASIPSDLIMNGYGPQPYFGLQIDGDRLYAGSPQGVLAFDVADPAAPRLLERFGPDVLTMGARSRDGLLLAISRDGLHVLDAAPEATLPPVCGEAGSTPACLDLGESARLSIPLFRSFDPVWSWHDGVHPGAYANGVLHVPMGPSGLVSVDVSGETPRLLSHTASLDFDDVAADGSRLYGVDTRSLTVVDVAQPERPVVVGSHEGPLYSGAIPAAIAVRGERAVVTGGWYPLEKAVRVFDVGDPTSIAELGSIDGISGVDVALDDSGLAFVATKKRGLQIFDVSQPAAIRRLAEVGTFGVAARVVVASPYVYVLNAGDEQISVAAFDVSEPATPLLADVFEIARPTGAGPSYLRDSVAYLDAALAGDTLFVGTATDAVAVDVGDPHALRLADSIGPAAFARALAVDGDRVVIAHDAGVSFAPLAEAGVCDATGDTFLDRTDVGTIASARGEPATGPSDPRDPDRDGRITNDDAALCLDACLGSGCVPAPRVPACRAPGETGRLDVSWFGVMVNAGSINGTSPRRPLRIGETLWEPSGGFDSSGLFGFDVSDPDRPRAIANLASIRSHAIAAAGEWLVSVEGNRLHVVDVRDPRTPRVMGELELDSAYDGLAIAGAPGRAYLTAHTWQQDRPALRVVDLDDPAHPVVIGTSQETGGYDVAVAGSHAFVARNELTVFDLADETAPTAVASLYLAIGARQVALAGDLLLVLGWRIPGAGYELVALDVSDPAAPVERSRVAIARDLYELGSFLRNGSVDALSIAGSRAFAAGTRGAIAIDISDPDAIAVLGVVGDDAWTGGVADASDRLLVVNRLGVQTLAADPLQAGPPGCPAPPPVCGLLGIEPLLLLPLLARRSRRRTRRVALLAAVAAWLPIASAEAAVTAHTSRASFEAEVAARGGLREIDFDSIAAGTELSSETLVDGVGFSLEAVGDRALLVTDAWATTSGSNSLGTTSLDALASGDAIALALPPAFAVGVTVIAANALPGDFELHFAGASIANGAAPDAVLPDADAFFLGLVSDDVLPASNAEIVANDPSAGDAFAWNADDVLHAPEPAALGASAVLALVGVRLRAQRPR